MCLNLITRSGFASTNDFQFLNLERGEEILNAWHIATASASVESKCLGVVWICSIDIIIYCTCFFDAAPLPVTAFFISRGEYSVTGISEFTPARIATPRACPNISDPERRSFYGCETGLPEAQAALILCDQTGAPECEVTPEERIRMCANTTVSFTLVNACDR